MAVKTTLEQLEEVQTAISKVLKSQAYRSGANSNTRAELKALTEREDKLLIRYQAETGSRTGPKVRGATPC